MNCRIKALPNFVKELKRLHKKYRSIKQDYENLLYEIRHNPKLGIDLGNGIRKVRMAKNLKVEGKATEQELLRIM